jgi:hypothetical protein
MMTPLRLSGTYDARRDLLDRERNELLRNGVPTSAIDAPVPLRSDHIAWFGETSFEPEACLPLGMPTERAFWFLVLDQDREPIDIVAWAPARSRLGSWLGRAWALGQEQVFRPRLDPDGALPIWRDPLGWLRAGRRGLVLIDLIRAADELSFAGPLLAEDLDHAIELRDALSRPAPRILVPTERSRPERMLAEVAGCR